MSENSIPEKLEQVDYPVPVNTCAATGEKLEYDGKGIPKEAYAENRDAARAGRIYSAKAVEAARKGKGKDEPKQKDTKAKDEKKAGKPEPTPEPKKEEKGGLKGVLGIGTQKKGEDPKPDAPAKLVSPEA